MRTRRSTRIRRQRQAAAAVAVAACATGAAAVAGIGGGGGETRPDTVPAARKAATPAPPTLPGGGTRIFPDHRVVGFYGNPAAEQLGILGIGSPDLAGRRLLRQARPYARKTRPVLPAMELISTIATFDAGPDGKYRRHERARTIRRYLKAARKIGALLILDIQPGRADFFEEATRLERWLREPDVGLALDPEWRVVEGQIPGQVIGSVDAREVNAVSAWLDQLVTKHRLPQKLFVIHQFTYDMIKGRRRLQTRDGLAIVLNADGFGGPAVKKSKYHAFVKGSKRFHEGFKLFYEEDVDLMSPRQVLRLRPPPDFVVYE